MTGLHAMRQGPLRAALLVLVSPAAFAEGWTDRTCKTRLTYEDGYYALAVQAGAPVRCEAKTENTKVELSCAGRRIDVEGQRATLAGLELFPIKEPDACAAR